MASTTKPLTILVLDQALYAQPEIEDELTAKGHRVGLFHFGNGDLTPDVMIGPQCWRIPPESPHLAMWLRLMVAGVRAQKYPTVTKKVTKHDP